MKAELGQVHYLTTQLTFPNDKDQWIRQDPIRASTVQGIYLEIERLDVPDTAKADLCSKLAAEWKDHNGVWVRLKIETTKRNKRWGVTDKRS